MRRLNERVLKEVRAEIGLYTHKCQVSEDIGLQNFLQCIGQLEAMKLGF